MKIYKLTYNDIGREVIDKETNRIGIITAINKLYVFVKFDGCIIGKAYKPERLRWK